MQSFVAQTWSKIVPVCVNPHDIRQKAFNRDIIPATFVRTAINRCCIPLVTKSLLLNNQTLKENSRMILVVKGLKNEREGAKNKKKYFQQ